MKLNEFVEETGIPIAEFARRSGVTIPVVRKALKGGSITLKSAYLIHMATKGKVSLVDLLPDKEIKS